MKKNLLFMLAMAITFSASAINKKAVKHTATLPSFGKEMKLDTEKANYQINTNPTISPAKISSAASAKPGVSYRVPQGTLFYGLSNDYHALSSVYGIASPYTTWTFKNTSFGSPVFNWTLNQWDGAAYTSTTKVLNTANNNLSVDVTTDGFELPNLKGTENSEDSIFVFGKNYASKANKGYIDAGGSSYDNGTRVLNFSNWFRDLDQITWTFKNDTVDNVVKKNYAFGTGKSNIDAVVAYYEKPQTTLYFEGANFFLGAFEAPTGTEFTLRVITVDTIGGDLTMKDTLATSYLLSDSVLTFGPSAYTMPFKTLVAIDADGLESEIPYLELDDAFVLELSWTNSPDLIVGVNSSYYDGLEDAPLAYYPNHAYFYAPYAANDNKRTLLNYSWSATLNTSLTNAAYTYLVSATDTITAPIAGGSEVVTLMPYYGGVWVDSLAIPSWIKYAETEHYVSDDWGTDYNLTFEALPENVVGRSADVVFYTWGAKKSVRIMQGIVSSTKNIKNANLIAVSTQNGFNLSYPADFKTVSVYNIAGQLIGDYKLSASGKSDINLNVKQGSYILKFIGAKTATLKVVK